VRQADASPLPQLGEELFLADGGIETYLIFKRGIDLPEFASFDLLGEEEGRRELRDYYMPFLELAARSGTGFVLESPTWRASPRWGAAIGHDEAAIERANRDAIALMEELREAAPGDGPVVISGCIGPQDDGYSPAQVLDVAEARAYHGPQVATFAETAADMISAITMTYAEEAIGIARAAAAAGIPAAISFTVETDGRLPSGQDLGAAIEQVDADPESEVAYYMINCAHPTHFESLLEADDRWLERVRGVRANASRMSHAELDEATELDDGDPDDLASRYVRLRELMPNLTVLGGCCGTDIRHVERIAAATADSA
jgi:S-methylmethionine-dependent homocysteine/selenocysteine methylase